MAWADELERIANAMVHNAYVAVKHGGRGWSAGVYLHGGGCIEIDGGSPASAVKGLKARVTQHLERNMNEQRRNTEASESALKYLKGEA